MQTDAMTGPNQRVAIVTGGLGGLGQAVTAALRADSWRVATFDILPESAGPDLAVTVDVTDESQVSAGFDRVERELGPATAIVCLAGVVFDAPVVGLAPGRLSVYPLTDWQRTLAVNLTGPFHTIRAALPHLLRPQAGNVVNVSSTAGVRGTAYAAAYAASKAGLLNFTKTLALEFASRDLRFNCVCPGGVRTPLIAKTFVRREDLEANLINYSQPPKLGHLADPIDVARVIAFLASDDARMVNGVGLLADGGALA